MKDKFFKTGLTSKILKIVISNHQSATIGLNPEQVIMMISIVAIFFIYFVTTMILLFQINVINYYLFDVSAGNTFSFKIPKTIDLNSFLYHRLDVKPPTKPCSHLNTFSSKGNLMQ